MTASFPVLTKTSGRYNSATWNYELDADKKPVTDPTLTNPRCVFQLMKEFYSRYTPEMVTAVTGLPKEQFLKMAATYGATGQPGKAGTLLYAMGGTQHTTGVQIIRSYTILQQLLGNMGVPGGGINALRGENNVQGSTDMAILFHILPGYLPVPSEAKTPTLKDYIATTPKAGYWSTAPSSSSACSRPFGGRRPPRPTTSPTTTCPRSARAIRAPAIPGFPCSKPWAKAPSRA